MRDSFWKFEILGDLLQIEVVDIIFFFVYLEN